MKKIYHVYIEDLGEFDMFLDDKTVIWWWHCNDASYRGEYMRGLFALLGTDVIETSMENLTPIQRKAIKRELKEITE